MCSGRDGQRYKVNDATLDYANDNCFYTAVISNNIESMIADYINKNF